MPGAAILDSEGAYAVAQSTPSAVRATLAAAVRAEVPNDLPIRAVVLASSARSRLTSSAVIAIAAERASVPVVELTAGPLPRWVGSDTLVVALDSGVAEGLLSDSTVDGVPIVAVGGNVDDRPQPIVETAAALAALEQFGVVSGLLDDMVAACGFLEARWAELVSSPSAAQRLAKRVGRTIPLVYGAGAVGHAATAAWKHSVNRNAKAPAFANAVPGVDHDEVCGWAQHGDVTRQVFTLVVLRHPFQSTGESHRLDVTAETCDEIVAGVHQVTVSSPNKVAALFELMLHGEVVSLEMAALADIDPGPTPITDRYL